MELYTFSTRKGEEFVAQFGCKWMDASQDAMHPALPAKVTVYFWKKDESLDLIRGQQYHKVRSPFIAWFASCATR